MNSLNLSNHALHTIIAALAVPSPTARSTEPLSLSSSEEWITHFLDRGLEAFTIIGSNLSPFSHLSTSISDDVCRQLLHRYFPFESCRVPNVRSRLLSIFHQFMGKLYEKLPDIPDIYEQEIIEACLKGDVEWIKSHFMPEGQKRELYCLAAENGHIQALTYTDPQVTSNCLLNCIRRKPPHDKLLQMIEAMNTHLSADELSEVLYRALLENNTFSLPQSLDKEALLCTLLKLIESGKTDVVSDHLYKRVADLEIEEYLELLEHAKKYTYHDVVQGIEKAVRFAFVKMSSRWEKEKVMPWLQTEIITTEDTKRACRRAYNKKNLETAHFLMQQAGLYYTHYKSLKSYFSNSNYKQMAVTSEIIPRESYIKDKFWDFLFDFHVKNQHVRINPYQGTDKIENESDAEGDGVNRQALYDQVNSLEVFWRHGPARNMQHGHKIVTRDNRIVRCLVLETEAIQGAIEFTIRPSTKVCVIDLLEMKEEHRKNHFGQSLLHCAMFVGLLYKCSRFEVETTPDSFEFYKKQGFVGERKNKDPGNGGDLTLSLDNASSLSTLLGKVSITAPHLSLDQLVAEALHVSSK